MNDHRLIDRSINRIDNTASAIAGLPKPASLSSVTLLPQGDNNHRSVRQAPRVLWPTPPLSHCAKHVFLIFTSGFLATIAYTQIAAMHSSLRVQSDQATRSNLDFRHVRTRPRPTLFSQ